MSIEAAISFFITMLLFSLTPGPGFFALMARGLTQRLSICMIQGLGMATAGLMYLVAACFGLATIAAHWGEYFIIIRLVGAAYLIFLAYKMWKAPAKLALPKDENGKLGYMLTYFQGFAVSASNPKNILFYVALLPSFLDVEALSNQDIALTSVVLFSSLMAGYFLIVVFAGRGRKLIQTEKAVKILNRSASSIMASAGVFLAARS
ncbi:LysE family translocator [Curvivirga sp.]|uniref:LysE family translocator n=1 Tax=Curvivirga sp. TaxID=2856848 RepID=UPI003B598BF4